MSSESILTCTRPFFNVFCQTRKEMEGENQVTTNFGTKILTCHSSVLLKNLRIEKKKNWQDLMNF